MGKIIQLISIGVLMLSIAGCNAEQNIEQLRVDDSLFAMNTYMTFTAYGENAQEAIARAKEQISEMESLWSVTEEGSEIYRANHSGGESIEVSKETSELIAFALDMAEKTEGSLDPTIYPVLAAWGFTTDQKRVPAQEELERLLLLVDYSKISLTDNLLTVPDGMELDLGAVGKGYTADLVADTLREYGVQSAIFSLGGNIQTIGSRSDGDAWRIGIKAPWEKENLGVLEVRNSAVVTSGGYENYFEDEYGNIYWHILDPSTGYPSDSGLQAVTVVGKEGKLCDALSTALFVMGAEKAEEFWRENGGFDLVMITDENEIILTEGIADSFTLSDGRNEAIRVLQE